MYLFILESIGTSELFLIGMVALIIFGPRKLPQMAKTLGKFMADFRSTTNEFKTTWQKEAGFDEESGEIRDMLGDLKKMSRGDNLTDDNSEPEKEFIPEIKQVDPADIKKRMQLEENTTKSVTEVRENGKRDWL